MTSHAAIKYLDRVALAGMVLGLILMFQPRGGSGFRLGFFLTMFFTVLHIVTSHLTGSDAS